MKRLLKASLRRIGLEIHRIPSPSLAGDTSRPIANTASFLEDLQARGFDPQGIIDIGANAGEWTKMAKRIFPQAHILMIEPQEEMKYYLDEICRSYRSVDYVQAGAGSETGELVQTIWPDLAGSSFLPVASEEKLKSGTQRRTPVFTVNQLLEERKNFTPDLVKLDVQGFEIQALKGASKCFGITQVFIMETSLYRFFKNMPITRNCIEYMADNGYELYDITDYLRRPLDGALAQIDLAFALRNGALRSSNAWGI